MNKIIKIVALVLPLLLMTGCKEQNWMDWKAQNEAWMANNATLPNIETSETGLQYQILNLGNKTDVRPQNGCTVYCDYEGRLINQYVFDRQNNAALSISVDADGVGGVIAGFAEGLKKIYTHGDIILYIPWDLAYGEKGSGTEGSSGYIPPYSTLIFKIHLSSVSN